MKDEDLETALEACEREPVHLAGAIHPNGALISMNETLDAVRQVSANLASVMGVTVDDALGMTPEQLLTRPCLDRIRQRLDSPGHYGALFFSLRAGRSLRRFRLLPYRSDARVVVEFEPSPGPPELEHFAALADCQAELSVQTDRDDLLAALTTRVRELTGYDRVMVYQFDEEWNGSVVAESRATNADSYLNHHFPASDIPPQVRRLYRIAPVRDIPDAAAERVPLVPERDPVDDTTLDLSCSVIRAVAPIHATYLANMGVRAALSIAVYINGELWGLLACHAAAPTVVPPALRDALRTLVETTSSQLELIRARREAALIRRANESRAVFTDQRGEFPDPAKLVDLHGTEWLSVFGASGAMLSAGEHITTVGSVPETDAVRAIVDWLEEHHRSEPSWSSSEIGATGLADCCTPYGIAGLLAVPLPIGHPEAAWLVFFRAEKAETRTWAGGPNKSIDSQTGRLSPRESFASWQETVRGRSIPWLPVERRAAHDLATDLAALIAADEIHRLNQRLEKLASHDHLTGLWNRYRMEEAIDHEISVAERYDRHCALVMFDIDHFKRFNDTWGHDSGDEVLIEVARAVFSELREPDHVGRWGGEEFMVLVVDTSLEDAARVASRLRHAIEALTVGEYGGVTASFGVAGHRAGEQRRDLLKRVDQSLYAAKEAGRNRVEVSRE